MGLDMYLNARRHFSEYDNDSQTAEFIKTNAHPQIPGVFFPPQYIDNYKHFSLKVPVMYWRKANHIHAWFVREVQEGVDECQESYVSVDKLRELAAVCKEVLAARGTDKAEKVAAERLPTQSGFFFGNTAYDEYYYSDLDETLKAVDQLLADHDSGKLTGWQLYYQSSW